MKLSEFGFDVDFATFGTAHYVYRAYRLSELVYIGETNNPLGRLGQHYRAKQWFRGGPIRVVVEEYADKYEAIDRECRLVGEHNPPYNIIGRTA